MHYILDDKHNAVAVSLLEWAKWFETASRRVKETNVGDIRISTVFLGLDHSFGEGKPLLFETMIFGGEHNQDMDRYSTWQEAEDGHERFVNKVRGA